MLHRLLEPLRRTKTGKEKRNCCETGKGKKLSKMPATLLSTGTKRSPLQGWGGKGRNRSPLRRVLNVYRSCRGGEGLWARSSSACPRDGPGLGHQRSLVHRLSSLSTNSHREPSRAAPWCHRRHPGDVSRPQVRPFKALPHGSPTRPAARAHPAPPPGRALHRNHTVWEQIPARMQTFPGKEPQQRL